MLEDVDVAVHQSRRDITSSHIDGATGVQPSALAHDAGDLSALDRHVGVEDLTGVRVDHLPAD
jgi:hypothetical protein